MKLVPSSKFAQQGAWTFVEMLVAASLSAIFMGAAALVLASITHNSKRLASLVDVQIGSDANSNFYGNNTNKIRVYAAPNFGRLVQAEELRDEFIEDLSYATACFALPREEFNTVRPEFLDFPSGVSGATPSHPQLDSPEAFRNFLAYVEPDSVSIFNKAIRNVPDLVPAATVGEDPTPANVTIFMLGALTQTDFIRVNAVYEIDFLRPTGKDGIYASVRRYKNGVLTNYYDIYYPEGPGNVFHPPLVAFERKSRLLKAETAEIDRFKVSPGSPFYFIFLPDPAINPHNQPAWTASESATSPRAAYEHMAGKTSFMVVAPMFPSL